MKKILDIILTIILFIWQILQNIVALVMIPFLGKMELISFRQYCWAFKCSKMQGGISLGNFAFLSESSGKHQTYIDHEQLGHTVQSKILGPLYLFVIGIPSILHTFHSDCPCYYHFYTEKWANKCAKLKTIYFGRNCYLMKDE